MTNNLPLLTFSFFIVSLIALSSSLAFANETQYIGKSAEFEFQSTSNFSGEILSEHGTLEYTIESYDKTTDTFVIKIKSNLVSGEQTVGYTDEFVSPGPNPLNFKQLLQKSALSAFGISDVDSKLIGSDNVTVRNNTFETENYENSFTLESELIGVEGSFASTPVVVFAISGNSKVLTPSQILHSFDFELSDISFKGIEAETKTQLQSELKPTLQSDFNLSMILVDTDIDLNFGSNNLVDDSNNTGAAVEDNNQPDSIDDRLDELEGKVGELGSQIGEDIGQGIEGLSGVVEDIPIGEMEDKAKEVIDQIPDGGGCLIATATYGSELAPQVQQLRELRDNQLLQTQSGQSFMTSFNEFYYSFSPKIADFERENPLFKETVKIAITPVISSLSLLNHVDLETESQVLGYGISLILLNLGMYVGIPALAIAAIKRRI